MSRTRPMIAAAAALVAGGVYFAHKKFAAKPIIGPPADFHGQWASPCLPKEKPHYGPHRTYIRIGPEHRFSSTYVLYADDDCTSANMSYLSEGLMTMTEVSEEERSYTVTYDLDVQRATVFTDKAVALARRNRLYGAADWRRGHSVPLEGPKRSHDIIGLKGDKLYFGDPATGDQTTRGKRPTAYEKFGYSRTSEKFDHFAALAQASAACLRESYALVVKTERTMMRLGLDPFRTGKSKAAGVERGSPDTLVKFVNGMMQELNRKYDCYHDYCQKKKDQLGCHIRESKSRLEGAWRDFQYKSGRRR